METSSDRVAYLSALCRTVPHHIVEGVLAAPTEQAIGRQVFEGTVMYADIVGFTSICDQLALRGEAGCDQLLRLVNRLFERLLEDTVFPYGGYLIQFGGDSLTVVFRGDEHARRGAAAALACRRMLREGMEGLTRDEGVWLMLRVGLAAGEVRLPVLGDLMRRVTAVAGATAHRALELQKRALPNTVLVDRQLIEILGDGVKLADRRDDCGVLEGLDRWPARRPIAELGVQIKERVDEKIALLEPFVPPQLARRLRSTPFGLRPAGELRDVVIVFVEIWGLDDAPADDQQAVRTSTNMARSLLRSFFKYGGVISKVDLADRGHRVMVLFGLHDPSEHDAERALLAAMEATARVKGFAADQSGRSISIRTGAHAGQVYHGSVGSDYKHDITVIGDAVNVTARTASAAGAFEILVTDTLLQRADDKFLTSAREPIWVKGKPTPLALHVVHGASEGHAHYVQRRGRRRFYAGRADEICALEQAVDQAFLGQSQFIGICGEAGTGKSSLLTGIIDRWIERGGIGVLGRCRYATKSTPLAPVAAMLNNYLGITPGDSDPTRFQRIRDALIDRFQFGEDAPELLALLQPVERPDGTDELALDVADTHTRDRLLSSIVRFVEKRLDEEPLLYLVEDLHLADSLTVQLIGRLTTIARERPFIMLGTYRPDPALEHVRRLFDREVVLTALSLDQTGELLRQELSTQEVEPELVSFLWRRTGGNPAHLVEVIRFLFEHDLIQIRAGTASVPEPGLDLLAEAIPPSLAHVALARLQGLGEVERRLLRTASAIGHSFSRQLLEIVSDIEIRPELVSQAVSALETQRLLVSDALDQPGYMFRDELVRAVTYKTIPKTERERVHRRIADALERLPSTHARRAATSLAFHRERAGQLVEAAKWYERAIEVTAGLALDRETSRLAQRWSHVAAQLPADRRPHATIDARVSLLRMVAAGRQGEWAETARLCRRLAGPLVDHLDPRSRERVAYWLGEAFIALGDPAQGCQKLRSLYEQAADDALRFDAALRMARQYIYAGAEDEAVTWLDRAEALIADDPVRQAQVEFRRAVRLLYRGQHEEARAVFAHIRELAQRESLLELTAMSEINHGYCDLLTGRFDQARVAFERALPLVRALGNRSFEANALINLGQALLWGGRPDQARPHLERALAIAEEIGDHTAEGEAQVHLGAALALTQDPEAGAALCERGLEAARRMEHHEVVLAAELHLLRLSLLRQDHLEAAELVRGLAADQARITAPLFASQFQELRAQAEALGAEEEQPA